LSALRLATQEAHRRGITSIHTAGGTTYDLELFDNLRRAGTLTMRVYGALAIPATVTATELDALDELRDRYSDDPLFKAGVAELTVDDHDNSWSEEQLNQLVAELDRRQWQIVIDAHGDRALALALAAYKHAFDTNAAPSRGRRHRIESRNTFGPVDFSNFQALGVTHPGTLDTDSLEAAIDAFTRQAAWASFDEQRKGTLARDMLADVVVLTKDIFAVPPSRLSDADVSVTIFDGKVVFQKNAETEY
jgi:predicted amidohydrolase YtcJ